MGIKIYGADSTGEVGNVTISNAVIKWQKGTAIYTLTQTTNNPHTVTISNSILDHNTSYGIKLEAGTSNVLISNNTITQNATSGVTSDATNVQLIGNFFSGNGTPYVDSTGTMFTTGNRCTSAMCVNQAP